MPKRDVEAVRLTAAIPVGMMLDVQKWGAKHRCMSDADAVRQLISLGLLVKLEVPESSIFPSIPDSRFNTADNGASCTGGPSPKQEMEAKEAIRRQDVTARGPGPGRTPMGTHKVFRRRVEFVEEKMKLGQTAEQANAYFDEFLTEGDPNTPLEEQWRMVKEGLV